MIQLYNTLTNKKERFIPIIPNKISMYVCGITIYDYCHIGHARVFVVYDVVYRYLSYRGYDVTYVRNITDVDDKIINTALENEEPIGDLTKRFTEAMHEDALALHTLPPDIEPKATENIKEIIAMICTLIDSGNAYAAANGDVYYAVSSYSDYGKLSGRKLDELRAGERIEVNTNKQEPLDFVLWKSAKPGEPYWDSPWGKGRPGWHIECSAMSKNCLGNHFDIHGGGRDLQFPHHENEIAQSEAANCEKFVNYWMHNGLVRINDEKMSKSLNNFFTIREVLKIYKGEEIRFFMLASQYRSPLNYSMQQLDNARAGLTRLYTALRKSASIPDNPQVMEDFVTRFETAMDDDFNTPEALAVLFDLASEINKQQDSIIQGYLAYTLIRLGDTLGILQANPERYLHEGLTENTGISNEEIEALLIQRSTARAAKDFETSDSIRDKLLSLGISLEDKDGKTSWRRNS